MSVLKGFSGAIGVDCAPPVRRPIMRLVAIKLKYNPACSRYKVGVTGGTALSMERRGDMALHL